MCVCVCVCVCLCVCVCVRIKSKRLEICLQKRMRWARTRRRSSITKHACVGTH